MSIDATLATWKLSKQIITSSEKLFLLSCADRASEDGICWPSVARIAADTCMDDKTIYEVRQSCIKKGLLEYTGEKKGRTGRVKVMRLTYINHRHRDKELYDLDEESNTPENGVITNSNTPENGSIKYTRKRVTESLSNNLKEKENNITNVILQKKKKFSLDCMVADNPHDIPEEQLEDWLETRKAKKAPVTKTAWQRLNTELTKIYQELKISPQDAFEQMLLSGWQAVKVEYLRPKAFGGKPALIDNDDWAKDFDKDMF